MLRIQRNALDRFFRNQKKAHFRRSHQVAVQFFASRKIVNVSNKLPGTVLAP